MFWADNTGCSSTITTLLENQNITLADLLEEDEILHECKLQNKKLIEFLERPAVIEELIQLIISEPSGDDEQSRSYRRPMLASEIISCGLIGLIEHIANDTELLKKVYSFLDSDPPLNPLLSSYFFKTFCALLSKHCGQDWYSFQVVCLHVLNFFKSTDFLSKVLKHLGTSAIMDTLQRVIHVEGDEMKKDILNWLDSQGLIEQLVHIICGLPNERKVDGVESENGKIEAPKEKKDSEAQVISSNIENVIVVENKTNDEDKAVDDSIGYRILIGKSTNAAQLICDIIINSRDPNGDCSNSITNPLSIKCKNSSIIELLLNSMFCAPVESQQFAIVNGVQVLLVLLNDIPGSTKASSVDQSEINRVGETITSFLPKLKEIIVNNPPKYQYGYGNSIEKPLGAARLSVIHLIEVLINLDNTEIATAIVQSDIVPVLFDMFVEYKWNNFLHAHVENIIKRMCTFVTSQELFGKHLFVDCKLMENIVKAWEENDVSEKMCKPRHGYMGHLTAIANILQSYIKQYPDVIEGVSDETKENWEKLVNDSLKKVNEVQKLYLGGYHPSRSNNAQHQQSSSQMYDTDTIDYTMDDDELDATYAEESNNAEHMFNMMCETLNSQEFINELLDTKFLSKDLFPNPVASEFDERMLPSSKLIDQKILSLASKLSECEPQNTFDKWLPSNATNDWDEDGDFNSTDVLTSMTVNSSSAWGPVEEFGGEQSGWADFSKLENPLSDNQDSFNSESFPNFTNLTFASGSADQNDMFENQNESSNDPFVAQNKMSNEDKKSTEASNSKFDDNAEDYFKSEITFDNKTLDMPILTTSSEVVVNKDEVSPTNDGEKVKDSVSTSDNEKTSISANIQELSTEITKLSIDPILDAAEITPKTENEDITPSTIISDNECSSSNNEVKVCDQKETVDK